MQVPGPVFPVVFLVAMARVPSASAGTVNVTPVTMPLIAIDPVGNPATGAVFFINGTTTLPVSHDPLLLRTGTANVDPAGYSGNVRVLC